MDNPPNRKARERQAVWIIERYLPKKAEWSRIAQKKAFTLKGCVGYISRLRVFFPDSIYRFRKIDTDECYPSELFGV